MHPDTAYALFEKHEDENLKFERIPPEDKLHPHSEICGLMKVFACSKEPFHLSARHENLYVAWIKSVNMTEEDVVYLARCGICYDDNNNYLYFLT